MESWFGTFKTEVGEIFESPADAKRRAFSYIEPFYNQRRRHSTLGYRSPAEFERRWHQQRTSSTAIHSRSPDCQSPPWTRLGTGSGGPSHTGLSP
jgi:hypothetical protein